MLPERVERELAEGEAWDCYLISQAECESPVKDIWENTSHHQEKKHKFLIKDFIVQFILLLTKRIFARNSSSIF